MKKLFNNLSSLFSFLVKCRKTLNYKHTWIHSVALMREITILTLQCSGRPTIITKNLYGYLKAVADAVGGFDFLSDMTRSSIQMQHPQLIVV